MLTFQRNTIGLLLERVPKSWNAFKIKLTLRFLFPMLTNRMVLFELLAHRRQWMLLRWFWNNNLVRDNFTVCCEMIFAVIILQFAVIDLQNAHLLWNDRLPIIYGFWHFFSVKLNKSQLNRVVNILKLSKLTPGFILLLFMIAMLMH